MITIQEIHYYTKLVEDKNIKNLIVCPFDPSGIILTKLSDDDTFYFECLSCESTFKLGQRIEKIIKNTIDKYKNQR